MPAHHDYVANTNGAQMALNRQAFSDHVALHLLRQGKKSMALIPSTSTGEKLPGCAYRGEDGCKCAIGGAISDDKYMPAMENRTAQSLLALWPLAIDTRFGTPVSNSDIDFLNRWQAVHDAVEPKHWLAAIGRLYGEYHLDATALRLMAAFGVRGAA